MPDNDLPELQGVPLSHLVEAYLDKHHDMPFPTETEHGDGTVRGVDIDQITVHNERGQYDVTLRGILLIDIGEYAIYEVDGFVPVDDPREDSDAE